MTFVEALPIIVWTVGLFAMAAIVVREYRLYRSKIRHRSDQ